MQPENDNTLGSGESADAYSSTAAQGNPAHEESSPLATDANLELVQDISVNVSIELGRTHMRINELLALGPGSVIELERLVDEPLDVLVNGTLVAHGEVVVIDGSFGVRLTQVAPRGA